MQPDAALPCEVVLVVLGPLHAALHAAASRAQLAALRAAEFVPTAALHEATPLFPWQDCPASAAAPCAPQVGFGPSQTANFGLHLLKLVATQVGSCGLGVRVGLLYVGICALRLLKLVTTKVGGLHQPAPLFNAPWSLVDRVMLWMGVGCSHCLRSKRSVGKQECLRPMSAGGLQCSHPTTPIASTTLTAHSPTHKHHTHCQQPHSQAPHSGPQPHSHAPHSGLPPTPLLRLPLQIRTAGLPHASELPTLAFWWSNLAHFRALLLLPKVCVQMHALALDARPHKSTYTHTCARASAHMHPLGQGLQVSRSSSTTGRLASLSGAPLL